MQMNRREGQQQQSDCHRVRHQHALVADLPQQLRENRLHAHRRHCLRHNQHSRLHRRKPQSRLVKQRQQKRHAANSQPRKKAPVHRDTKRANVEQPQVQQRKLQLPRMNPVRRQQRARYRQQPRHLAPAQLMLAKHLQHIRQQRNP